jgi:hypothetical protein
MNDRKIVDYTIVERREIKDLIDFVKFCIDDGWTPIGSIHSILDKYCPSITNFHQAMVKYEELKTFSPVDYAPISSFLGKECKKMNDMNKYQEVDKISDTQMLDFLEEKLKINNIHFFKRPQSIEFQYEDTNSYSDTIRLSIESAIKNDQRK